MSGAVSFTGTPPAPKKIDTSADPVCGTANPNLSTEDTVVKDGKLANAFVYIKDGTAADGTKFTAYTFDTPSDAVTLDQKGCHYVPHVLGVQVNQKFKVTNSDPTQHNIHPIHEHPGGTRTQPNGAASLEKTFARQEVLIPVKVIRTLDEIIYRGGQATRSLRSPPTTAPSSSRDCPPGKYTVAACHENGGAKGTEKDDGK